MQESLGSGAQVTQSSLCSRGGEDVLEVASGNRKVTVRKA